MHILGILIAIIGAISIWYWRMKAVAQAGKEAKKIVETAVNLPRRLAFKRKTGRRGLSLVDDPREAATIMMLEVARAAGDVSAEHKAVISDIIQRDFELGAEDAGALIAHAGWVARDATIAHIVIDRMADFVMKSPGMGPEQLVDLDGMLVTVSEAEGRPNADQLDLLQAYRDKIGLRT